VIFEWHSRFKAGRLTVEDDERSGDQALAECQKMLKKFESLSMKTIAEQSINSQTPVGSVRSLQEILTENLNMRNTAVKFVP
jgi:hypothetical protein